MDIDGPVTLVDLLKIAMFIVLLAISFRAGMVYEDVRHETEERKWRDGK